MKMFLSMAMLVACVAFVGCGGVAEQPAVEGVSQEQMDQVANDKDRMMKEAMEKMKGQQSPTGQTYEQK
jgi:hypothetical protein